MFNEDDGPQLPKNLTTAIEINSVLQSLVQKNIPLTLTFPGRSQRCLSYIIASSRDKASYALDELVPDTANAHIRQGEPFHIEAYVDGVRVNWHNEQPATLSSLDGNSCYWLHFPAQMRYHQRRNAFRAETLPEQAIKLIPAISNLEGHLLDLSATGCKVRFKGVETGLSSGQFLENTRLVLPEETLELTVEVRHLDVNEETGQSLAGFKFHDTAGVTRRSIERYVYHLQREARRHSSDDFF